MPALLGGVSFPTSREQLLPPDAAVGGDTDAFTIWVQALSADGSEEIEAGDQERLD
jgi:hypothetical protein